MTGNMRIYNAVRSVPQSAQKPIQAGRLKGKTDINPMWRIKELTERFGPCGIGWWYTIEKQWLEHTEGGEVAAFCDILLYYREGDVVSQGIPGTGGSMFIAKEKGGLYVSDECYKMAMTDAISVACKAIGFGADVYWNGDKSKYDRPEDTPPEDTPQKVTVKLICAACKNEIPPVRFSNGGKNPDEVADYTKKETGLCLCWNCYKKRREFERVDAHLHEDAGDRI